MRRILIAALAAMALASTAAAGGGTVTRTGWVACEACSAGRAASEKSPGAPNRECAQKCIREGSAVVFYDETSRTLWRVDNPDATKGQESHRVEVTGTIDEAKKTIHVGSVKVLQEYVAKCGVPPAK